MDNKTRATSETGMGYINSEARRLGEELVHINQRLITITDRLVGPEDISRRAMDTEDQGNVEARPVAWPVGGQLGDTMDYLQTAFETVDALSAVLGRMEQEV